MTKIRITDELLAAFADGNTTLEETMAVLQAAKEDETLRDVLEFSDRLDNKYNEDFTEKHPKAMVVPIGQQPKTVLLPYEALAATTATNDCVLACEKYVLKQRRQKPDYDRLRAEAEAHGWLRPEGTALYNIGRLLELARLSVVRRFDCTTDILANELAAGCSVIVAVDANILADSCAKGGKPNHAIVVTGLSKEDDDVEVHDPDSPKSTDHYPVSVFEKAWAQSKCFMVSTTERGVRPYEPHPIDVDDVALPQSLDEITEAIAENAHEVWAQKRQAEGWRYGPMRDDRLKETPDMVPYCELTDSEKEYDRATAMRTIKLLYKLGYAIVKRQ